MKKIILTLSLLPFLGSCASTQPPFVVLKYTWVHCWNACGKKDNLAAVSSTECICVNGDTVPLHGSVQAAQVQNASFLDRLIAFINGE